MVGVMFDVRRKMIGLFCLMLPVLLLGVAARATTPAMTTVSDTIYRADGRPAGGSVLISWPAFSTIDGATIGAATKSITLGAQGALLVDLVPNIGATPAGVYYSVVFHLDDGTSRTEYWIVPTTSPVTVAAVRAALGTAASAAQMASRQYVDVALAAKANDAGVVHLSGNETIAGIKQFSSALTVPLPSQPSDAVNKEYVDGLVINTGNGSYVSKNGDSMSGPLTLSAERSEIRRGVYDRLINVAITVAISAAIALHDHLGLK
jgi:trimeric autotransporter adhesin